MHGTDGAPTALAAVLLPAACLGAALVMTTTPAFAQAPPAAEGAEGADTVEIRELVVTATRLPTPRAAIPAPVTVIHGDDLRERGIARVADALRTVAGVSVVESGSWGGRGAVFMRGGESDYVQVLVDGVPVNEPGGAIDFANLGTANVDRIEVVRGPTSVVYGTDAVSGVVHIITRAGGGGPTMGAAARAGSHGTTDVEASLRGGGGALDFSAAVARFATDGIHDFNSRHSNLVGSGAIGWRPHPATSFRLSLRRSDARFHYPTDGAGRLVDTNAFQLARATTLSLEAARAVGPRAELRLLLGSHHIDSEIDDSPDGPADTLGVFAFRSEQDLRRRSADLRGDLRLGPGTVVSLGGVVEEASEESANESESEWGPSSGSFTAERRNRAVYAQVLAAAPAGVSITGGLRLEDNESFGSFVSYRAGLTAPAGERLRLRGVVGNAFKEPTFFESYAEGFVTGNPDLRPERSRSWEVGAELGGPRDPATLGVTYFDQRFRDMIDYTFEPPAPGGANYFNIARARSRGLEIEATLAVTPRVVLAGGYIHLDTRVEEPGFEASADAYFAPGDQLLRRPSHSGSLRLSYAAGSRGSYTLTARGIGSRIDQDFAEWPARRVTLPPELLLDGSGELPLGALRPGFPELAATVRIENLLGAEYDDPANFPTRGRVVLVGLRASGGG